MIICKQLISSVDDLQLPHLDAITMRELTLPEVIGTTAIVILQSTSDTSAAEAKLASIRQHDDPRVYLLPVLLVYGKDVPPVKRSMQFDEMLSEPELHERMSVVMDKFLPTMHWLQALPNAHSTLSDTQIPLKIIRLLASRRLAITPRMTDSMTTGFVYDLIQPFFTNTDNSFLTALAFLETERLVHATYFKRAHFCPSCSSAFMNFLEVCPDCGSDHLHKDEMLHHFVCGHVDKKTHFQQNNRLICPKCDGQLNHIGVDYDKPSMMYNCQSCALVFQDPVVNTECFSCGTKSHIDDVIIKDMHRYALSALGESAAMYGLDALFTSILQSDLSLCGNREFKRFLTVEKARLARQTTAATSVAVLNFVALNHILSTLGKRSEQVFKELSAVIKAVLRESDVISAFNESLFIVLLTGTSSRDGLRAMQRLREAIQGVTHSAFAGTDTIEIDTQVFDVNSIDSPEHAVEMALNARQ
jgi:GGDEF domain-containing protein